MKPDLMRQFITFLGAGVIATSGHYSVLLFLVEIGHVLPVTASMIGAVTGAVISYYLNRNYTFVSKISHARTAPKFFIVAILAIVFNTVLMATFTIWLRLPYFWAQVLTTCVLIIVTFGLNKLWSFRE
ncbi:GtrA family protein [Amylibacter sp. SFDW26]|uniref:GtrA family protein n=1 Tax=Amylibacter sp. SFDW26 TaxID=2652722 RepID=UPI0012621740|nr:GtrA family protein [Amylibacter sp. SFDW26]KAB7614404.1 GtrA family protein [Amylibacter sp. SFDW26]